MVPCMDVYSQSKHYSIGTSLVPRPPCPALQQKLDVEAWERGYMGTLYGCVQSVQTPVLASFPGLHAQLLSLVV